MKTDLSTLEIYEMQALTFHFIIPSCLQPTVLCFAASRFIHPCTSDLPVFIGHPCDSVLIGFYVPGCIPVRPVQDPDVCSQVCPYANRGRGQTSDMHGPVQLPSLSCFPRMLKGLAVCCLG